MKRAQFTTPQKVSIFFFPERWSDEWCCSEEDDREADEEPLDGYTCLPKDGPQIYVNQRNTTENNPQCFTCFQVCKKVLTSPSRNTTAERIHIFRPSRGTKFFFFFFFAVSNLLIRRCLAKVVKNPSNRSSPRSVVAEVALDVAEVNRDIRSLRSRGAACDDRVIIISHEFFQLPWLESTTTSAAVIRGHRYGRLLIATRIFRKELG